ncbi:MAG: helix-turn-helix transcriptional regulator [Pseudomonadota bacterium]
MPNRTKPPAPSAMAPRILCCYANRVLDESLTMLGRRIAARRKEMEISQEVLAEATRLTVSYISRLETGRRLPTLEVLSRIAKALRVQTWTLLMPRRVDVDELGGGRVKVRDLAELLGGLEDEDIDVLVVTAKRLVRRLDGRSRRGGSPAATTTEEMTLAADKQPQYDDQARPVKKRRKTSQ